MELNEIETIILQNTNKQYKYIARCTGGELVLLQKEPEYTREGYWISIGMHCEFKYYNHLFRNLKCGEWFKFR